jgi:dihydroorotase
LLLPLTLKWARESGASLALAIDRITRQPAQIMGIDAGVIAVEEAADLCIFDPVEAWVVSPATLCSQGRHTPFLGCELLGRNRLTVVGGCIRFERRL